MIAKSLSEWNNFVAWFPLGPSIILIKGMMKHYEYYYFKPKAHDQCTLHMPHITKCFKHKSYICGIEISRHNFSWI